MKFLPQINSLTIILIVVAFIIGGAAAGGYSYYQNQQRAKDPQKAAQEEGKKLIEKVGKLIELPQGEEPTIATITDKERLKDQPFFQRAENEDKVLIFTQAKKAVLYRPGLNKVIEVAPINIGTASAQPKEAEAIKIALYNGTTKVGLTRTAEAGLKSKLPDLSLEVVVRENAEKSDYTKTIVVDLSGRNSAQALKVAQALSGEVAKLPEGESKPKGADLLIILGEEK